MGLTFIHTADWHLGRMYRRIGPKALDSRAWRFEAVRNVYDLAAREKAAFILVAGDVFQTDTPTAKVIGEAVALLRDTPVKTVIIPGNHDPLTEGSVWKRDEFRGRLAGLPNVVLALACEPIELPEYSTTIFPCPVTSKRCPEDLSAWIPQAPRGGDRFRIGLAHGIWQAYDGRQYFENFIARNRTENSGLDYLALGDLHSYTLGDHEAAKLRCYYSGTVECTAADEDRPGFALVVRVEAPGHEPNVIPARVGRMRPVVLPPATLSPGSGFADLQRRVQEIENPGDVLLAGSVAGSLTPAELAEFHLWLNGLLSRFLGIDFGVNSLCQEPTDADFEQLGLDDAKRRILKLLRDPDPALLVPAGAPAEMKELAANVKVRREALALYYSCLRRGVMG